ncbi:MAG: hypothetical protein Q8K92_04350 [Leadbetterella sp.]|nr:hypothetical protein [Leadbetterella sp.]
MRSKRKSFNKDVQFEDTTNTQIQPFQQRPSENNEEQEGLDRINAHDLFSHYTAEIIKEDTIFVR